jgi:Family of unknown function (DUF5906)
MSNGKRPAEGTPGASGDRDEDLARSIAPIAAGGNQYDNVVAASLEPVSAAQLLALLHEKPQPLLGPPPGFRVLRGAAPATGPAYYAIGVMQEGPDSSGKVCMPQTTPTKEQIREVRVLALDLDPVGDATPEQVIEAGRAALDVTPTVLVCSGRGLHALLVLECAIAPGRAERLNEALIARVRAALDDQVAKVDATHNCNRFLRLPGTVNERTGRRCEIVHWSPETRQLPAMLERYLGLPEWTGEKAVQQVGLDGLHPVLARKLAHTVERTGVPLGPAEMEYAQRLSAAAQRVDQLPLVEVTELVPPELSDHARVQAVRGVSSASDFDERTGRPLFGKSHSGSLLAFCAECYRTRVDPAVLLGICLSERNGINKHVREQVQQDGSVRRRGSRARLSTILRAAGWALGTEAIKAASEPETPAGARPKADPVAWVNERYFAVMEGGKPAFYRDEAVLDAMTWQGFTFELAPCTVPKKKRTGEIEQIPFSRLWRASPARRYYPRGFVLDPGRDHPGAFNLWRGFGVEPRPGDWCRMRAHILEVLAAGNADHADYIERWIAWKLQNPAAVPRVALVFKGGEGTGKGALANSLVRAFGAHGLRIQNMAHLTGKFNAHLRHCCLLFADEAVAPDQSGEGPLKGTISEPTVPIERKGYDVVKADNHVGVIMATNNDWAVPAGPGARRYAVFAVSDHRKGNSAYFTSLFTEINGGGLEAMVHDLRQLDLSGWHPEAARPDTKELSRQKSQSLSPVQSVWLDILQTGTLPCGFGVETNGDGSAFLPTTVLLEEVRRLHRDAKVSVQRVADLMKLLGFLKRDEPRPRGFHIPAVAEAKAAWDDKLFSVEWDGAETWHVQRRVQHYDGPPPDLA